jgi:hypothetical protein
VHDDEGILRNWFWPPCGKQRLARPWWTCAGKSHQRADTLRVGAAAGLVSVN